MLVDRSEVAAIQPFNHLNQKVEIVRVNRIARGSELARAGAPSAVFGWHSACCKAGNKIRYAQPSLHHVSEWAQECLPPHGHQRPLGNSPFRSRIGHS
jgi:hypothetical protein